MKKISLSLLLLIVLVFPLVSETTIVDLNNTVCPVMGGKANPKFTAVHDGVKVQFCCGGCDKMFLKDPKKFLGDLVWEKEGVKYITKEKLSKLMDSEKKLVILDVLGPDSFSKNHIKGAINIPFAELKEKVANGSLDRSVPIVTYCASYKCKASTKAAQLLEKEGFRKVYDYKGGLAEWTDYMVTPEKGEKGCNTTCGEEKKKSCKDAEADVKKCGTGCKKPCCAKEKATEKKTDSCGGCGK